MGCDAIICAGGGRQVAIMIDKDLFARAAAIERAAALARAFWGEL
jgi:hypothetical protein